MKKHIVILFISTISTSLLAGNPESYNGHRSFAGNYNCCNGFGSGFYLRADIGMNNYLQDGKFPETNNELYSVRPWGSWNVFLGVDRVGKVAGPLYINYGTGVNWYNFKFEYASTRMVKENDGVVFFTEQDPDVRSIKSKLTATYLDVFLVPTLYFGKDRYKNNDFFDFNKSNGFRIGLGGYAGYKINSHTKHVFKESGNERREKKRSGYYLENLKYGAKLQIGVNGLDFYANYDLNELFVNNKGPKLNAFSFGIIL